MKLKVRRTKAGLDGYELFDGDEGGVIKSGLTAAQIYREMLVPQIQATLAAIGRFLEEADSTFSATLLSEGDVVKFIDEAATGDLDFQLADPDDIQILTEDASPSLSDLAHRPAGKSGDKA